jgi:dTDP-4-dehydrorhamnose reductase
LPHIDSYLTPLVFGLDIANRTAAIPGVGEEVMSLTYTKDLAKFVVLALGLEKWDETMHCYSVTASFNDLLKVAEESTGEHQAQVPAA